MTLHKVLKEVRVVQGSGRWSQPQLILVCDSKQVCEDSRKRHTDYVSSSIMDDPSLMPDPNVDLYMDPCAFHFLSPGFATVLPMSLNLIHAGVRAVLLVPKKGKGSTGLSNFINPAMVAHSVTYLDWNSFSGLQHTELLGQTWSKDSSNAVHVAELTKRFNKVWGEGIRFPA